MWDWLDTVWQWCLAAWSYGQTILAWTLLAGGCVFGLIGVVVPVIPGAFVVLAGALLFAWLEPGWMNWWAIGALGVFTILDRVVDILGTALGARWFGGTKWAVWGALAGGVVGLFFGIFGLILGPVIGATVAELLWAKRRPSDAARSGMGAGVGFGISMAGRLLVCLAMIGVILADVLGMY